MTRHPILALLALLAELVLVVLAFVNWNDPETFYRVIAMLGLFALWDIERAVRND